MKPLTTQLLIVCATLLLTNMGLAEGGAYNRAMADKMNRLADQCHAEYVRLSSQVSSQAEFFRQQEAVYRRAALVYLRLDTSAASMSGASSGLSSQKIATAQQLLLSASSMMSKGGTPYSTEPTELQRDVNDIEAQFAKQETATSKLLSEVSKLAASAESKLNRKDFDGAISDYTRGAEIMPQQSDWFASRGAAKNAKGDLDGAISDYSRALEINPKDTLAFENLTSARRERQRRLLIQSAQENLEGGNPKTAIAEYDQAIAIAPNDPDTHLLRSVAYAKNGNLDAATSDLNEAVNNVASSNDQTALLKNIQEQLAALNQSKTSLNSLSSSNVASLAATVDPYLQNDMSALEVAFSDTQDTQDPEPLLTRIHNITESIARHVASGTHLQELATEMVVASSWANDPEKKRPIKDKFQTVADIFYKQFQPEANGRTGQPSRPDGVSPDHGASNLGTNGVSQQNPSTAETVRMAEELPRALDADRLAKISEAVTALKLATNDILLPDPSDGARLEDIRKTAQFVLNLALGNDYSAPTISLRKQEPFMPIVTIARNLVGQIDKPSYPLKWKGIVDLVEELNAVVAVELSKAHRT